MSNIINPKTITITHSGKDTDGNPLGGVGLTFKGFEVEVDEQLFLSMPVALNAQGSYAADITAKVKALPNDAGYTLRARTVCTIDGASPVQTVYSEYKDAAAFDVNFARIPSAPLVVSLS